MAIYNILYIRTIGQGHRHGDRRGIGIGLWQGMTAATYKMLRHRQATLIRENLQCVSASATNSYLWQMTKCFGIGSPHSFAAINKVRRHRQKTFGPTCTYYGKKTKVSDTGLGIGTGISMSMSVDLCDRLLQ